MKGTGDVKKRAGVQGSGGAGERRRRIILSPLPTLITWS
jgi:hypothetical protein